MADPETIGGASGIGGALGWLASFFTFKGQVRDLKDDQEKLDRKVDLKQSITQCDKNHDGYEKIFDSFKEETNKKLDSIDERLRDLPLQIANMIIKHDVKGQ